MVNYSSPFQSLPVEVNFEILKLVSDNQSRVHFALACKDCKAIAESFSGYILEGYSDQQTALIETITKKSLNANESSSSADAAQPLDDALDAFYGALKRRCLRIHPEMTRYDFLNFALFAIHHLKSQTLTPVTPTPSDETPGSSKVETASLQPQAEMQIVIRHLISMIATDILDRSDAPKDRFTSLLRGDRQSKGMQSFFAEATIVDVATILREGFKQFPGGFLDALAAQFFNRALTNPKYNAIKEEMLDKLTALLKAINLEIAELEGSSNSPGNICVAFSKVKKARTASKEAEEKLKEAMLAQHDNLLRIAAKRFNAKALVEIDLSAYPELPGMQKQIKLKTEEYRIAEKEFVRLKTRFNELIQFKPDEEIEIEDVKPDEKIVIGGAIQVVMGSLEYLDVVAQVEAQKIGSFLQKLSEPLAQPQ